MVEKIKQAITDTFKLNLLEYVKLYFAKVASDYCKQEKLEKSTAACVTRVWLTSGMSDSDAITNCKSYNAKIHNGSKNWGEKLSDIKAHKATMYLWFGIKLANIEGKIKLMPYDSFSFDDLLFSWLKYPELQDYKGISY